MPKFNQKCIFNAYNLLRKLDALVSVLKWAGSGQSRIMDRRGETAPTLSMDKSITSLEGIGVKIYGLKEPKIEDSKS